jgi:hypothetical protein
VYGGAASIHPFRPKNLLNDCHSERSEESPDLSQTLIIPMQKNSDKGSGLL